ncbi:MAG: hypothetical protein E7394_07385 [Ruminococcaceae bacterium]|nr:hypothetical protein [Oscillospiraceae bacterium]
MEFLTLEKHQKRIDNINEAAKGNRNYTFRHRIHDYMPGQVTYNLGDYPARFSIEPTEYDYNLLKSMAENGVELIQIHEEWNDAIRHLGADKFTSFDPEGMQKFVDLCHYFGIKIIPYISSGYFSADDPDFKDSFIIGDYSIRSSYYHLHKCSPSSAQWREYLLPRTFAAVDKYGFDGIYNDWGFDGINRYPRDERGVTHFEYETEIEDLLSLIYGEVKKRGGIYKLHADYNSAPKCYDRVYDYLWIGEGVKGGEAGIGKEFLPYVVPCWHMSYKGAFDPDFYYASVIPFMQFPLLKHGRPMLGTSINEDNIVYCRDTTGEYAYAQKIQAYMKENPDGPFVYSLWSSIPDDPDEYDRWSKYLALYRPMVKESSVSYIEIKDCDAVLSDIPSDIIVSQFINDETYMVVSNLSKKDYTLDLKSDWTDRQSGERKLSHTIKPGTILFLIK